MIQGKKIIYIIEDDAAMNHGIELTLANESCACRQFFTLGEIQNIEQADLVILDVNLPDGNGFDYLKKMRQKSNVPVLILTANDTELDEVTGLTLGADDYVTKPFSLMTLRLRVNNLLARTEVRQEKTDAVIYEKHGLSLDFDRLLFYKNEREIDLSKTEIRLLRYFTENEGITLSREKLIEYVWQDQQYVDENALSVSVKRLRDKIENDGEKLIHTIYGIGYVFK